MVATLYSMIEANFGIKTSYNVNPIVAQVEEALTKILSYNPNRLGLLISNTGAVTIYVSPLNTVTVGNGIPLVPGGGGMTLIWDQDFELVSSEFYARADGAACGVYILEVVSV